MNFYILTKRKILSLAVCLTAGILTFVIAMQGISAVAETASIPQKSPIYSVAREEKVLSISFDTAWGDEQTEELLGILDRFQIKSTFFVAGDWVDRYPESVKAISEAGHEVCNHSNTHPHMSELSRDQIAEELQSCHDKIEASTGRRPILFRPPYGDYSNDVIEVANSLNMHCIQWDVDSLDWKNPAPQEMKDRVLSGIRPGSIILFHNGARNTAEALAETLEAILAEGYRIVPVSELVYNGHYITDQDGRQHPVKAPDASSGSDLPDGSAASDGSASSETTASSAA